MKGGAEIAPTRCFMLFLNSTGIGLTEYFLIFEILELDQRFSLCQSQLKDMLQSQDLFTLTKRSRNSS